MMKKYVRTLKRGLMKRTFFCWWAVVEDKQFKLQLEAQAIAVKEKDKTLLKLENRIVFILHRRRLRELLRRWRDAAHRSAFKTRKLGRAVKHWQNGSLSKAWDTWAAYVTGRREKKRKLAVAAKKARIEAALGKVLSHGASDPPARPRRSCLAPRPAPSSSGTPCAA